MSKVMDLKKFKMVGLGGVENEEDLGSVIKFLLNVKTQGEKILGIEKLIQYARIFSVIERSKTTNTLELEDGDYVYLKGIVEKEIPAGLAVNKDLVAEVQRFIELK